MSKIRYNTLVTTSNGYEFEHDASIEDTALLIAKVCSRRELITSGLDAVEVIAYVHHFLGYVLAERTRVNGAWHLLGESSLDIANEYPQAHIERLITAYNVQAKASDSGLSKETKRPDT